MAMAVIDSAHALRIDRLNWRRVPIGQLVNRHAKIAMQAAKVNIPDLRQKDLK